MLDAHLYGSARTISCGEGKAFITGGVESMTRTPLTFNNSNTAFGKDMKVYKSASGIRFPSMCVSVGQGVAMVIERGE